MVAVPSGGHGLLAVVCLVAGTLLPATSVPAVAAAPAPPPVDSPADGGYDGDHGRGDHGHGDHGGHHGPGDHHGSGGHLGGVHDPAAIPAPVPTAEPAPPASPEPSVTGGAPTDPAPTDLAPTDLAPTDPAPTDPAPTDPAPTGLAPGAAKPSAGAVPAPGASASPPTGAAADDREIRLCLVTGDEPQAADDRPVLLGSYPASELARAGVAVEPPLVECAGDDVVTANAVTERSGSEGSARPSWLGPAVAALLSVLALAGLGAAHRRSRGRRP